MPEISDITTGASYRGDAALGGGSFGSFEINTQPIQQLAQYTYLYNRQLFEQRQKDADEKIAKLAELTAYDAINGEGKDTPLVLDALEKLRERSSEFASKTWSNPKDKVKDTFAFQKEIADYTKLLNAANQRAIKMGLEKDRINKDNTLSPEQRQIQLKDLQSQFDKTDIYTPINSAAKVDIPKLSTPGAVMKTADIITNADNQTILSEATIFDPAKTGANARAAALGLFQKPLPTNATEADKRDYEIRQLGNKDNKFWMQMAQNYNQALTDPKYSKTVKDPITGLETSVNEIDIEKVKQNPIVFSQIELINRYNDYANKKKADVAAGLYKDKIDPRTGLLTTVTADEWFTIDPSKPLEDWQIIYLEDFRKAAPDIIEKKATQTDNKIQELTLVEQRRNNTLDFNATMAGQKNQRDIANLPYIMAKIGSGTATKDEKSTYPIIKTQELVDVIGVNTTPKNFNDLTPEQQAKVVAQIGDRIDEDKLATATISIKDENIIVTGKKVTDKVEKSVTINIKPDDITKDYYNEINKNDAGKEAPERRYFKIEEKVKEAAPATTVPVKTEDLRKKYNY